MTRVVIRSLKPKQANRRKTAILEKRLRDGKAQTAARAIPAAVVEKFEPELPYLSAKTRRDLKRAATAAAVVVH